MIRVCTRSDEKKKRQILCLRIDDEKLCTVYETPDVILDLLW